MNSTTRTAIIIAFVAVIVLVVLFGSGTMNGWTTGGGMMGNRTMAGTSWMWIPTLVIICLGVLLVWVVAGKKK